MAAFLYPVEKIEGLPLMIIRIAFNDGKIIQSFKGTIPFFSSNFF